MRLVYITLGWAAGILLAANNPNTSSWAWLALAFVAAVCAFFLRRDSVLRWGFITLTALMLGAWRIAIVPHSSDVAQYNNAGGLSIEGLVIEPPDIRDDRVLLRVAVETVTRASQTVNSEGIVLVQAPAIDQNVRYGDRVRATGQLITPAEYDTFSYSDFLARSGVFSIMTNTAVEVLASGGGNPLYAVLLDLKRSAQAAIAAALPEPQAGLLSGILLGDESGIDPALRDAFAATGTAHVIAISGFNMSIISATVMGLLTRARVPMRFAVVIGIGALALYTIFVGARASVLRAAVMSSLLVIAPLFKRSTYVPASLAFVVLLLSAQNPTALWDIGFQLTFFATLSLALFATPLSKRFEQLLYRLFRARLAALLANTLSEPLMVTVAASIMTLPLIALYFSRLPLVMFVVNALIVPVQAALLLAGLAATLIALFLPVLGQILYWLVLPLLSWTIDVVRLFARLPFAEIEFHVDPRLVAVFFAAVIGGAMLKATQPAWLRTTSRFVRQRAVATAMLASGALLVVLIAAVYFSRPDGYLHVWFLDVGHSNAVLLQTPGGAHLLVDGGRFPSRLLTAVGDRLPFTDRTLEALFITEPDEFEFGALPAVLARYQVGVAITNGQPNGSEAFANLQTALSSAASSVLAVRAGYSMSFSDSVHIEVLNPQTQPEIGDSLDDNALVLRVRYGDVSFLLTSDLSQQAQDTLLEEGVWPLATVLQLPQHAAARSLNGDFLAAVQPSVAVVQSDRTNRRGDPDPDVLALLAATPILRTDQGGTLHLWTDGARLWALAQG